MNLKYIIFFLFYLYPIGFNLFANLEPSNQITRTGDIWRWKSRSDPLQVDDEVKQEIVDGIVLSFVLWLI